MFMRLLKFKYTNSPIEFNDTIHKRKVKFVLKCLQIQGLIPNFKEGLGKSTK